MSSQKEPRTDLKLLSPKKLVDAIFDSDVPEKAIRQVPAQQLYIAIKSRGIASSGDLIAIASVEQCRLMLDIDLWHGDRFDEKQFFEWLSIADAEDDLDLVRKVIVSSDLKLVAYLIHKYADIAIYEEATDTPPIKQSYTPDKGYTWIHINHKQSDCHFLLGRMLAVIHDYDARLFYQLIGIPGVATPSDLEEQSFEEREKRLQAEGIPDYEWCIELHTPLLLADAKQQLEAAELPTDTLEEGLIPYERIELRFQELLSEDEQKEEYALLLSAACRYFDIDYGESQTISFLFTQIRDTLTLGLVDLVHATGYAPEHCIETLHLSGVYRRGIALLLELKRLANRVPLDLVREAGPDSKFFELLAGLKERLPILPAWFSEETTESDLREHSTEKDNYIAISSKELIDHCHMLLTPYLEEKEVPQVH